jgi:protein O-mannosyl-transferase
VKQTKAFWMIAVVGLVCLTYANSLHNGFHFDDFHTVVDNPYIRSLKNIPQFFSDAKTFSVLPANRTYRPLVSVSLALDYCLGHGLNPIFFHLGTMAVFLLQIVAMQILFQAILDRTIPQERNALIALVAAAWYGVHPAMAETVNYVIQRGDIFSTCGLVVALTLYVTLPRLRRTGLYLVPFAMALLSKPPAIVFPAILFVYIAMFEAPAGEQARKAGIRIIPSVLIGGVLMWFQSAMTPKTFAPSTLSNYSYCITQPFVLLRYFGSFFLPIHLNVDTDLRAFDTLTANALWGFLFLIVFIAAILLLWRRSRMRPIVFGLLWFLIASVPTSIYRLSEVENDHRMFMPFVGLVLAVTWAAYLVVDHIASRWPGKPIWRIASGAALLFVCSYAWGAHLRNKVWHTEETLWWDDVQKSPHNGRGLMIYGLTQMEQGKYAIARDYFERALRYTPAYSTLEINLGVDYDAMGQDSVAEQHFRRAVQLAPADDETYFYYGRALFLDGRLAEALPELQTAFHLNPSRPATRDILMQAYAENGDIASARQLAKDTLALIPNDLEATHLLENSHSQSTDYWINVSLRQYQRGNYAASLDAAHRAVALQPNSAIAWNNIGAAYAGLMQWDLAVQAERNAIRFKPDFHVAQNNLAYYLQHQEQARLTPAEQTPESFLNSSLRLNQEGRYKESIDAARTALRLRPNYAEAWNNIAAGYASLGQWDEAILASQEAIRLKPDFQLAKNNLAWAISEKQKTKEK